MADDGAFKAGLFLIGSGSFYYYKSFIKHKLRRRMSDIPRSKIGTAAIGSNVEIEGKILNMAENGVVSPLSGKQGAAFIWELEELVQRNKSSSWEHLYTFHSTPFLYIHDDEEHTAAIDLSACEFQEDIYEHKVKFNDRNYDIPEGVKNLLSKASMLDTSKKGSFFSSTTYRLNEKVFGYDQPIYVLGAAVPCPDKEVPRNRDDNFLFGSREKGLRGKITELFQRKKTDRTTAFKYDADKNNVLDKTELAALMKDVEQEILSAHGKEAVNEYVKKAKLLFTTDESASGAFKLDKVYLSTKSEAQLSSHLRLRGLLGLVGGPIMIAAGVYILVSKFSS